MALDAEPFWGPYVCWKDCPDGSYRSSVIVFSSVLICERFSQSKPCNDAVGQGRSHGLFGNLLLLIFIFTVTSQGCGGGYGFHNFSLAPAATS